MRSPTAALLSTLTIALTGCGVAPRLIPSPAAPGAALQGTVHGGQQPVAGSRIYLMAANTSAYAAASLSLLDPVRTGNSDALGAYVLSDAHGNFSISGDYTCTPGQQVYALAQGGDSGTGANSVIGLIAVIGNCPISGTFASTVPFIEINEVSTVAAAFALAGYAYDSTHISSNGSPQALTGIANAFATAANLADLGTGTALTLTPAGNGYPPNTTVNTLANILASCVNTADQVLLPYSTSCVSLGLAVTGGNLNAFQGHAFDVATAAIFIAQNPGANVAALYALAGPQSPFLPALTSQPNDFTLGIYFYGAGAYYAASVAVDTSGSVWFANYAGTVSQFSPLGVPISPDTGFTGAGPQGGYSYGTAIDLSGNVWVTNLNSSSVSEYANTGTPISTSAGFTGNGMSGPFVAAIDPANGIWVPNSDINTLSHFDSAGTPAIGSGFGGGDVDGATSVAIDTSGNLWTANHLGNSLSELSSSGAPITSNSGYTGGGLNDPYSAAIDASGNIWVVNFEGNSLSKFSNTGTPLSTSAGFTGGGLNSPYSISLDGAGNVWAANYNSVSEFANTGTPISPSTGYLGGTAIYYPAAVATDSAGNIWLTGYGDFVSELVGAAVPVETPLAQALKDACLAHLPCTPTP